MERTNFLQMCQRVSMLKNGICGIKENIPWKELEYKGCEKIFAVNLYSKYKKKCCDNIIDIAQRTLELINEEFK